MEGDSGTQSKNPARAVPCPFCKAKVGSPCLRPSGHAAFGDSVHAARDKAFLSHARGAPCELVAIPDRRRHERQSLFRSDRWPIDARKVVRPGVQRLLAHSPRRTLSQSWYCLSCDEKDERTREQITAHLSGPHGLTRPFRGRQVLTLHLDMEDSYTSTYEWTIGGVKVGQTVRRGGARPAIRRGR